MIAKLLVISFQLILLFYFIYTTFNFKFKAINPIKVRYLLYKYKYKEPLHLIEVKYIIYSSKRLLPLYSSFSTSDLEYFSYINVLHYNYSKFQLTEYHKAILWYWIKQHNKNFKKKSPN